MKKIILIVILFCSIKTASFCQMYDLTWTNARFWNIKPSNSEATNTANFYTAIRWLITKGGGTLFMPKSDSAYLGRIVIPVVSSDSICTIRILGETPSEERFGTVDVNNAMPSRQVIIKSTATSAPAVISVSGSSSVTVRLENLDIRTYDAPQISGVDLANANRIDIYNCIIETGIFNTQAAFPATLTYGIKTPIIDNGAMSVIQKTTITGYYVGMDLQEHVSGDDVNVYSCAQGFRVITGSHAIHFGRVTMAGNNINIYGLGANSLNIEELDVEHFNGTNTHAGTTWQQTVADVKDSLNFINGLVRWWTTPSGGGAHTTWTMSGGTNLSTRSMAYNWSSNSANLYYSLGNVGIGTSSVGSPLDVLGADNNNIATFETPSSVAKIYGDASSIQIGTTSNSNLTMYANNTAWMCLSKIGGLGLGNTSAYNASATIPQGQLIIQNKIGVGNSAPTYPLDVTGATNNYVLRVQDGTRSVGFYLESSGVPAGFGTISNSDMGFFTNGGTFNQFCLRTSGNVTIGGSSDASNGKLQLTGNLNLETAGNKIFITTGTNASIGKSSAMTAGTITISTTAVTTNSIIMLTHAGGNVTNAGILSVGTITNGTSFVINSSNASDTDTVNWWIIN